MKASLFLILLFSILSCKWDTKSSGIIDQIKTNNGERAIIDSLELFFKSKGVVSFINTDINNKNGFSIYNKDGTIFLEVFPKTDELIFKGEKYKLSNYDQIRSNLMDLYGFSPKAFFPQNGFIFQFEYRSIEDNQIEIYVNREKSDLKYLKSNNKLFAIETWKQHLLGRIIDFNLRKNPIKKQPLSSSESINLDKYDDIVFSIKGIKGEWVEIECTSFCETSCPDKKITGWIKWRDKKGILIRFTYAC